MPRGVTQEISPIAFRRKQKQEKRYKRQERGRRAWKTRIRTKYRSSCVLQPVAQMSCRRLPSQQRLKRHESYRNWGRGITLTRLHGPSSKVKGDDAPKEPRIGHPEDLNQSEQAYSLGRKQKCVIYGRPTARDFTGRVFVCHAIEFYRLQPPLGGAARLAKHALAVRRVDYTLVQVA